MEKKSIFSTLEEPHWPRVPPMMRMLSINRWKRHLPKGMIIFFFLPQRFLTKHYMQKERVAWHPEKRLPMKLAVKKSENVEVYISSNNSLQALQGNRQKLSEWDIDALLLQTTRCDKTYLSHNALKCVAWHSKERLPMIDISSYRVRK